MAVSPDVFKPLVESATANRDKVKVVVNGFGFVLTLKSRSAHPAARMQGMRIDQFRRLPEARLN